jgi:RNA polymerase sigma factor (sigma-70 family)
MAAWLRIRVAPALRPAGTSGDGAELTDGEFLDQFLTRHDEAAFEALVRRHGPMVLGVCRRILGDAHDAEDAFQATFLVLVRRAASVVPREQVGNWLYGVAYRTALEARRMSARRRAKEKSMPQPPQPAVAPAEAWDELRPVLDEELNRLPDKYRLPVVLCDLEGRTRRAVARQLEVPDGTLSNRLDAARRMLARRLARRGVTLSAVALAALLPQQATAAVPPALVSSTVQSAALVGAGQATTLLLPGSVTALVEEVMKPMLWTKSKCLAALVLAVGLAGTGAGLLPLLLALPPQAGAEDPGDWRERGTMRAQIDALALALSLDGSMLATAGSGGRLELWDLATRQRRSTVPCQPGQDVSAWALAFSPDGRLLALGGGPTSHEVGIPKSGWVRLYDLTTKQFHDFDHGHTSMVITVAFSPDGKLLATAGMDLTLKLFDVSTRTKRAELVGHTSTVHAVTFSPDGKLLASAGFDSTVRLWNTVTCKETAVLGGPVNGGPNPMFSSVAFSPDGKTLAAGTWINPLESPDDIYFFDVATGQERSRVQGHTSWIEAVAFSPDGKLLASCGGDKLVRVWDVASGRQVAALGGYENRLRSVVFTPDGKQLISGGHEQTVRVWERKP